MANREIQPPGGDLGVNEGGRGRIIDMLIGKRIFGGNDGGSRGKSKRDYENEAKLLKLKYELEDQSGQAKTARAVEQAYQSQLNQNIAASRFLNAGSGGDPGAGGGVHDFDKLIPSYDMTKVKNYRHQDSMGNLIDLTPNNQLPGGGGDKPGPGTGGDGPVKPTKKRRTAADVRLDMKGAEDEYDAAVAAGASDEDLADLASRGSMLSDEHYLLARKEGQSRDKRARKKAGKTGGTAGYTFESLDGGVNDSRVSTKTARGQNLSDLKANVVAGQEALGIGSVGDDGSISMGDSGVRPAPSGESGVIEGTQFGG